ncbi:MAG: MOSC domain-containing protein [Gammaproteobacteria bacterium]|jgi:MOSC domain-containing protein YiiM
MRTLEELRNELPQRGRVDWIAVRPARGEAMQVVDRVAVDPARGLIGDRYAGRTGTRHVSLLQSEHLPVIASVLGVGTIDPCLLRRNILVSGINLLALKGKVAWIGPVLVEITGACHPCSRMEAQLGAGGYNAVRGHGGVTARILATGTIGIGDRMEFAREV